MEQPAIETRLNRLSLRQLANCASHNFSVQRRIKKKKKKKKKRKSVSKEEFVNGVPIHPNIRAEREMQRNIRNFSAMSFVDREFLQTDSHGSYTTVDGFY